MNTFEGQDTLIQLSKKKIYIKLQFNILKFYCILFLLFFYTIYSTNHHLETDVQ